MKLDQNSLNSVSVRNRCWKWNFTANFGVLSLGFDVKALIPQGLTGRPNYFGFLNNLMTLIICESLREIGEMADRQTDRQTCFYLGSYTKKVH